MPVYEYLCDKCQREFEVEQRISDDPIRSCPHCRSRKVKRLISRTSFVLKGSGWYSDLYASPGAKKEEAKAAESSDKGDKATAGDAKSDSKPDAKSETKSESKPAAKSDKAGAKTKSKPKAA